MFLTTMEMKMETMISVGIAGKGVDWRMSLRNVLACIDMGSFAGSICVYEALYVYERRRDSDSSRG